MDDNWIKKLAEAVNKKKLTDEVWIKSTKIKLKAYMSLHPKIQLARWSFNGLARKGIALASLVAIVVSTSVGVAAKGSIPGDRLYPVKVRLESIESAFLFSANSKTNFEVKRATTRLEEVAALAVNPKSDEKIKSDAINRLNAQVAIAAKSVEKLEDVVSLNATLQAHKEVLEALAPVISDDAKKQVLAAVDTIGKNSDQVKQKLLDLQASAENFDKFASGEDLLTRITLSMKETQDQISKAYSSIEKSDADSATLYQAEMKLILAQESLVYAEQFIANKDLSSASARIRIAMQAVTESTAILKTRMQIASVTTLPSATPKTDVALLVASSSPAPSPYVTVLPESSRSPLPVSTYAPLPSGALPVVSIEMRSHTLTLGEPLSFTLKASNHYKAPLKLSWDNSCQVDFAIDILPSAKNRVCNEVKSELYIQPGDAFTWHFVLPELLSYGNHDINAEVIGYGTASYEITIVPHPAEPQTLPNL